MKKSKTETRRDLLFDHLMEHEWSTWPTMAEAIGVTSRAEVYQVVRELRLFLADFPSFTVCATPQPDGEPWRYSLATNMDQAAPWVENRLGDTESRLETIEAVTRSLVGITDGRSTEGKKSRLIHKVIERLVEDLAELSE